MSESATLTAARLPVVYFIDDSATMREVIKIAFKKENVHVITCPDAASALAQFAESAPDAVITDVIMPDKDGYEVCDFIKTHERFGKTPVILMSGVVNKSVAERAMSVRADELMRKPFHPQDLIVRVKSLLSSKFPQQHAPSPAPAPVNQPSAQPAAKVLTNFFAPAQPSAPQNSVAQSPAAPTQHPAAANHFAQPQSPFAQPPHPQPAAPFSAPQNAHQPSAPSYPAVAPHPPAQPNAELQKLRNELRRLELLVKKLQAELEASHQYCASLESHLKSLES